MAKGWLPGPPLFVFNRAGIPLIPLDLAYAVARPWGDLAYALWRSKAATARRNYAAMLGTSPDDPACDRLARRCFRHFALYIAEMIDVHGWDTETVLDRLEIRGEQHFEEAGSHGKGIIFVSAHMGSAEIAAALVRLRGYRVTSVIEGRYPAPLMDYLRATRERMGVTLLPAVGAGINFIRTLRRRQMVALVVDAGVSGGDGIPVRFMGRETVFPAGPARLARLSGAPIVFGVAVRRRGGRFVAYIEPPLLSDRAKDAEEDARRLTQEIASVFERFVRRYPSQWYVFREIWPAAGG